MRIRALPLVLALALFVPLAGCGAPAGEEESSPDTTAMVAGDSLVTLEDLGPPTYPSRRIPCARVAQLVAQDPDAEPTDGNPVEISLQNGELVTDPVHPVVSAGQSLQWVSQAVDWVVVLKGDVSPLPSRAHRPPAKGQPGGGTVPGNADQCGYYFYVLAAYDDSTGEVHVLDPPIWVDR